METSTKPSVITNPFIISWRRVLLGLLVGVALISAATVGYYYLQLRGLSSPPTSSPKSATPSAQKDETAGWKTLETKTRESQGDIYSQTETIKFSFKYPTGFKVLNDEGTEFVTNDPSWSWGVITNGKMEAFARIASEVEKPLQTTRAQLGGKEAFRGLTHYPARISIVYFIPSVTTKEGKQVPFGFFCNYINEGNLKASEIRSIEWTCHQMASTFKFLD